MKPKILVAGSLNMDIITVADRFVGAGETVYGKSFRTAPGGKGANQAICAARLGADVTMLGRVGDDAFGRELIDSAASSGVDTSRIGISKSAPTGVADIQVAGGENRIVIIPGANGELCPNLLNFSPDEIAGFDMVILQHEVPASVNLFVSEAAEKHGVPIMLNPAPAAPIDSALMRRLTYISPNEHEAAAICGIEPVDEASLCKAAGRLTLAGAKNAIITLGEKGAAFFDGKTLAHTPAFNYRTAVDTTAAGDSFVASFCVSRCRGLDVADSMFFASVVAAITVSGAGAQPSLPQLDTVIELIETTDDLARINRIKDAFEI